MMILGSGLLNKIRIKGIEKLDLKNVTLNIVGTNAEIETQVNTAVNDFIIPLGYHLYSHLFEKMPLNYMLWIGPTSMEPDRANWWEELPTILPEDIK